MKAKVKEELENAILAMAEKVKTCFEGGEALKYSQSALNVAHALSVVLDQEREDNRHK